VTYISKKEEKQTLPSQDKCWKGTYITKMSVNHVSWTIYQWSSKCFLLHLKLSRKIIGCSVCHVLLDVKSKIHKWNVTQSQLQFLRVHMLC